jgi:hypothetical protein
MADSPVATKVHQALDAHRNFTTQIALYRESSDCIAKTRDFRLTQVFDLRCRIDARARADGVSARATDAVDVRQRDPDVFIDGNIDPCNTCHVLSLTLLMTRIRADDADHAIASNDFAIATDFSD